MKKYTFLLMLFVSVGFAQTKDQQLKIKSGTNVVALNALAAEIEVADIEREQRIIFYLRDNPSVERKFYKGSDFYEVEDIIDNKPVYKSTANINSARATRTTSLYPGGSLGLNLEGENMTIGEWDGGKVLLNHTEFLNGSVSRVTTPDSPGAGGSTDGHATHVAGTMVARGAAPNAKGMAPKAKLVAYNWTGDETEVISQINNNGLLLSNHSYGIPVLNDSGDLNVPVWMMGCYESSCRAWDQIAVNAPYYLMVTSAGNSGSDTYQGGLANGYDKLTGEKNAKNNLVVANASVTTNSSELILSNGINSSSSQGPSDDGRVKPDITGDGTDLYSTYNTNSTSYATLTGTSMASPNVAGTLLLLQQYYSQLNSGSFMRSSTLKGLVCHTAVDGGLPGPDPKFGWGLLNAKEAALTIGKAVVSESIILETELMQGEVYTTNFSVTDPASLKATICWIDPVGTDRSNLTNSPLPALVNDLDIRLSNGTTTFLPWKLQLNSIAGVATRGDNTVDNVESILVSGGTAGNYTLTVSHKGVNLSGGSQKFSLVVTGVGLTLSTKENNYESISYWPNPTSDRLYYKLTNGSNAETIKVFDMSGKQMNLRVGSDFIDVSSLQQGVYILKLDTGSASNVYKFVKK